MPTAERLANQGLRFNHFHTTALCSPTRTALLSGRNHHMNNMGGDHGDRDRVPRQHGSAPQQRGAAGRDAAAERLQHGLLRQEPRDRGLGGQPLRPDRPLADPLRLRQVLRLHRWRNQSMGAAALRWIDAGRVAEGSQLPLHDRHDQPGDDTGCAIRNRSRRTSRSSSISPRVPRTRRTMCRRNGSPSTRANSMEDGTNSAKKPWRGRSSWVWCLRGRSSPPSQKPSRTGTSSRMTRRNSLAVKWKSTPALASTRTRRSAG